ncbi:MAG: HlyC/CorC family transporter [Candidatus Gracilibacteria bacterium]|nr:HlyC/CorC family transporter [Candidatus Gracilibacteria bacterium]
MIGLFVILFLLSAFFSGTELALMSLPSHKIDALLKEGKIGSLSLKKIKENNDRLLITILIGNNLVNTYTAALATTIALNLASGLGVEKSTAIGVATGVVTFLLLMFGEIIPKSFAIKNSVSIALLVAPVYKGMMILLYPVIIFIEAIIKVFSKKEVSEQITDEEIESFIDFGKDSGTLEHSEHAKLKNVLEFGDILVEEIMTPRVKIEAISIESTVQEAIDYYMKHTHSRIPIYRDTIDKIDHFVTIRELLHTDSKQKLSDLSLPEVIKIPLNQHIDTLFDHFQKSHKHMAIAIDEYGGVAGLITLEDIIEEIFGEIRDETDKEVDEIKDIGNNSYVIESTVLIDDILDQFQLKLSDFTEELTEFSGETVGYMITHKLERFPENEELVSFSIKNHSEENTQTIQYKILRIQNAKIGKIEVKLVEEKHEKK